MSRLSKNQQKYLSDLSLLFVAAVWGGGFVAVKDALNTVTPMFLMAIRFVLATLFLYMFLFKWIGKLSLQDIKKGSVVGIILFLAFSAQTVGLQYTLASKQGFLTATYVVMVPFLSWIFYKKMPGVKAFLGSLITVAGIGLISFQGTSSFVLNIGDGLTLLCALLFAMHILSIEYFAKDMAVIKLAFVQIAVAAILFVITAFITEPIPVSLSPRAWFAIVYLAMFSTFLCFTVQTVAQKFTTSSHASIILSLESVFAALFGVILLKEHMSKMMLVGCGLIFIAILMVELNFSSKSKLKVQTGEQKL
ncbi:DMT family transporter [Fusibacter ferrireducens]|uniref:DMT family transporter n=1 Tax=Fusibacter ferrireducens TaxID=2785058 RepID=A0ABR9ZSD7_9FIRM|nr:DMT family transporter [Fusibacter ferrireducens]MBF4692866.1 DMT family transporter [Fusibacter ferrireducens]